MLGAATERAVSVKVPSEPSSPAPTFFWTIASTALLVLTLGPVSGGVLMVTLTVSPLSVKPLRCASYLASVVIEPVRLAMLSIAPASAAASAALCIWRLMR